MLKPRIQALGFQYKTGNGQRWTKQYTWEDYQVLKNMTWITLVPPFNLRDRRAAKKIQEHFERHPEQLLDTEPFAGRTLEEIQKILYMTSCWKLSVPFWT